MAQTTKYYVSQVQNAIDSIMEDDQYPRKEPQLMCPWVSAAPLGCTKPKQVPLNPSKYIPQPEPAKRAKFRAPKVQQRPVDTANHFYYFLKLMQTFPDVHPATLHSVMCLCGNNFASACDTLITAKNYKENYMQRKMMQQRYQPYQRPNHQLQAQTSNGQLYDIVSIVSSGDNTMPQMQYSIRNDGEDIVMVESKKIDQVQSDEKVVIDASGDIMIDTSENLITEESNDLVKEFTNEQEDAETNAVTSITEQESSEAAIN